MTGCRFVSTTEPRVVKGRHQIPCACDDRELGCLPCTETHCVICGRSHARAACAECLNEARNDLHAIADLCHALPAEAVEKGVQSEAMMLLGPAADPEAWRNRAASALFGRVDDAYLEDCRDELHPTWVLGTWEQIWRDHLDHQTQAPFTLVAGYAYLDMQIGYMSEQVDPAFDEFARELRACRGHLEDVLRDGIREERGAPCVQCERPMVRTEDHWECRRCHRKVTEAEYRFAVGAAYRAHSDRLTATDLAERIGVKASIIRVWSVRGHVRKRGKDHNGLTLYDVSDAIAKRDNPEEQAG
jgi:ribosomal protein L37AE/L43A